MRFSRQDKDRQPPPTFGYRRVPAGCSSDIDLAQVKKELIAAFHRHQLRSRMRNLPFQERSLAGNAAELSRIAGAYRFEMNWNLLKMGRALGAIDQNIGVLNPDIDYNKETARYIQRAAERKERPMCETMPRLLRQMELFSQALKPTLLVAVPCNLVRG